MCGFFNFIVVVWLIGCAIASYIMSEKDREAGKDSLFFLF